MEKPIKTYRWKEEYELGVKLLDNQHKKILELVNLLVHSINQNTEQNELPQLFFKLMNYAENYFLEEEIVLKEYPLCNFEKHQEEHNKFIQQIALFQDEFSKNNESVSYQLLGYLIWWIKNRILQYDKETLLFLKQKI